MISGGTRHSGVLDIIPRFRDSDRKDDLLAQILLLEAGMDEAPVPFALAWAEDGVSAVTARGATYCGYDYVPSDTWYD